MTGLYGKMMIVSIGNNIGIVNHVIKDKQGKLYKGLICI